ncbi:MAG TPA: M23 family metallopeptidase [Kofleriaceae bacterium]|nr:M23 family metallopeptidase [Kofleriaceae bacterium]
MKAALHGHGQAQARTPAAAAHATEPVIAFQRKPRMSRTKLFAIVLGVASLSPCNHVGDMQGKPVRSASVVALPATASASAATARTLGPPEPDDETLAREFMGELSDDRWIHPLAGPKRRMPIRASRVFGAGRNGDRPGECRSGHCGVDIGGEMWGEPVMAVHDGVVDRVKRVDEGNGGMYVRLAHREGKVFTQYFHLAAIPRDLQAGDKVKMGQVIGLLGDTGTKESAPHLHFAVSVKPTPSSREIYMDPEPLIALWPLRVPRETGGADAAWDPGVPLGAAGRPRLDARGQPLPRKADRKRGRARAASAATTATAEAPEAPAGADEADEAVDAAADSIGDAYEADGQNSGESSGDTKIAGSKAGGSKSAAAKGRSRRGSKSGAKGRSKSGASFAGPSSGSDPGAASDEQPAPPAARFPFGTTRPPSGNAPGMTGTGGGSEPAP